MDTEYILDCAAELGEVTPLEGMCLNRLKPAYQAVRHLVDNNQLLPHHFLENTARSALNEEPVEVQHWVALESLRALEWGIERVKERASSLVQKRIQDELGITEPSPFNDLIGVSSKTLPVAITCDADVSETSVVALLDQEFGRFKTRLTADVRRLEAAVAWYREDNGARFRALQRQFDQTPFEVAPAGPTVRQLARQKSKKSSLRKKAHAAIKKATKLFMRMGQEDNLKLLVSGQEVTLSHEDSPLKFVLKPLGTPGWLEERTLSTTSHTPYDLFVTTKEDVFVARLCVFMDRTPVLDQLLALSLFVRSGDELEILEKANWFGFGPEEGKSTVLQHYPQLENKFPKKSVQDMAERHGEDWMLPVAFRREQQHWEPFKGRVEAWIHSWLTPAVAPALELSRALRVHVEPPTPLELGNHVRQQLELLDTVAA